MAAIKDRIGIVAAVTAFVPGIKLRRQGHEFVALSPFKSERTPSFTIDPRRGVFYCFATDQGGDAVRFVELLEGCDFVTAARRLAERCIGMVPETAEDADRRAAREAERRERADAAAADDARDKQRHADWAREIWNECIAGDGTLAERYLTARGIDLAAMDRAYGRRVPASLRFHRRLRARLPDGSAVYFPAMVGAVVDAAGAMTAIHRTFLDHCGTTKAPLPNAKLTLGTVWGSFGPLTEADGDRCVMGEGYETTLTTVSALARRGMRVTSLSGIALGNIVGAGVGRGRPHPAIKGRVLPSVVPDPDRPGVALPAHIRRLVLLEDADGSDRLATRARLVRGVAKFRARGVGVSVASPEIGCDFNDMVQEAAA